MNENDCKCKDQKYLDLFSTLAICDWNQERNVDPDVLPMEPHDKMVMSYWWVVFVLGLLVNSTVIFMILSNRNLMVTASHVYALHMAIADLLLILILPVHMREYRTHPTWKWIKSWAECNNTSTSDPFLETGFSLENLTSTSVATTSVNTRTSDPFLETGSSLENLTSTSVATISDGCVNAVALNFGRAICRIYATIKSVNFVVSIYFLMLMAIDRYIAIHCNKYAIVPRNRPPKRAHLVAGFVWFMALIITFPIWRYTTFDTVTYRCLEDWGIMNDTIPTVPENEREFNDQMCVGNFHYSENYTSNCNYSTSGFDNSNYKMRHTSNTTPLDGNDDDYFSNLFYEKSENETDEDSVYEITVTLDGQTFSGSSEKGHLDPFEWVRIVQNDAKGGCKMLKEGQVNVDHEAMLFVTNFLKNCDMELNSINECACDTSAEFQQHTWLIFIFAFTVPIVVITYCYVKFLKSVYSVARSAGNTSQQSRDHAKEIKRLSFLVFCLIFAFLLCWGPAQLITVLKASGTLQKSSRRLCRGLLQSKNFLVWTSAVINSLIYMSMGGFRRRIKGSIKEFRESRSRTIESRLSRSDPRGSFLPSTGGSEWNSMLSRRESNHQLVVNRPSPLFNTTSLFENGAPANS